MGAPLYSDGRITLDDRGITIRMYYFPFGTRFIPYPAIRSVRELAMGRLTGKWRIWGMGAAPYWFHLDPRRPWKDTALVLDTGGLVKAVLTPDDPGAVLAILRRRRPG